MEHSNTFACQTGNILCLNRVAKLRLEVKATRKYRSTLVPLPHFEFYLDAFDNMYSVVYIPIL